MIIVPSHTKEAPGLPEGVRGDVLSPKNYQISTPNRTEVGIFTSVEIEVQGQLGTCSEAEAGEERYRRQTVSLLIREMVASFRALVHHARGLRHHTEVRPGAGKGNMKAKVGMAALMSRNIACDILVARITPSKLLLISQQSCRIIQASLVYYMSKLR